MQSVLSSDALWKKIESDFEDAAADIRQLRLETTDEALSKTFPVIYDDDIGCEIKHPDLIPSRKTDDRDGLAYCVAKALEIIPQTQRLFSEGQPTPELMHNLQTFHYCRGVIDSACFSSGDDRGHERAGKKGGRPPNIERYKWICRFLVYEMDSVETREDAEISVAKKIRDWLKLESYPTGIDREWLESYLNSHRDLKSTFCKRHLSLEDLSRYALMESDVLPEQTRP